MKMDDVCREMTDFVTRSGTCQLEIKPFGLVNAPTAFQGMMDEFLRSLPFARAY